MKRYCHKLLLIILPLILVVTACEKVNLKPTTSLSVRLTNNLTSVQELTLDVREVKVSLDGEADWITLKPKAGRINLADLQTGKDTLIANGDVPATRIVKQLRLVLGSNNTVNINKQSSPLNIVTTVDGGLDVAVGFKMNKENETVTISMEPTSSIQLTYDGKYELRPVLKIK